MAMDVVTLLEGLRRHGSGRKAIELDLLLGAEGFHDRIKALPRPAELLTQLVDKHPAAAGAEPMIQIVQVASEGVGLAEPGLLLVLVEPGAQGLTHGGVTRRFPSL